MLNKRLYKLALFVGVPVVLLATSVFSGFASDVNNAVLWKTRLSGGHHESIIDSGGIPSLEEMVLYSDLIAVARLKSVGRGVEHEKRVDRIVYTKTLEFTFQVEEYLKGDGDDQVVGIVFDQTILFKTAAGANLGIDPDPERSDHWDDRRAVLFLRDDSKDPDVSWKAGRYFLGWTYYGTDQSYAITSRSYRPWLPAASDDDKEVRFLLQPDLNPDSSPRIITLTDLKAKIGSVGQEAAGQTEAYVECIQRKYEKERKAKYWKEKRGRSEHYHRVAEVTVESGMPQGTKVYTDRLASTAEWSRTRIPLPEGLEDRYLLAGDSEHFAGDWPGEIFANRPIPQGEYKIYHSLLEFQRSMCTDTISEEEQTRNWVVLTVEAPDGTLHEGFFDPVSTGKGLIGGPISPLALTDANGANGALLALTWEAEAGGVGAVKLLHTPNASLTGHTLEFIDLDGSVQLSLAVSDAQADDTSLVWKVAEQPWQSGDQLMLRVKR